MEVEIPRPAFRCEPSLSFPYHFSGYRIIPGTPGDRFDEARLQKDVCACQLGQLLSVVHSIDRVAIEGLGLRTYDGGAADRIAEIEGLRDVIDRNLPPELLNACRGLLEETPVLPTESSRRKCLVHADLQAEHILLREPGTVTGVIDWGDAGIGDPACDFAGIYAWIGQQGLDTALRHYTAPMDPGFLERAVFYGQTLALIVFGWSLKGGADPGEFPIGSLYTAFSRPRC